MSFDWLILLFLFIIFAGAESRDWGGIWGSGNRDWFGQSKPLRERRKTGFQLRMERSAKSYEDVVVVHADDYIDRPDPRLEQLIEDGKIEEAKRFRSEMASIAEEMDDEKSLRKYAIYGAKISAMQKELKKAGRGKPFKRVEIIPIAFGKTKPVVKKPEVIKTDDKISTKKQQDSSKPIRPPLWSAKGKEPSIEKKPTSAPPPKPITVTPSKPPPAPKPVIKKEPIFKPPQKPTPPPERFTLRDPVIAAKTPDVQPSAPPALPTPPKPPEKIPEIEKIAAESKPAPPPTPSLPPPVPPKPPPVETKPDVPKPEVPQIPRDFTPAPPGPVTLGGSSDSPGEYVSGPVDMDAFKKSELKKKAVEEEIDPDDYTDLISL